MPQINAHLAVEPLCNGEAALLITDAYGHITGRVDLTQSDCHALSEELQAAFQVQVVDTTAEEVVDEEAEEVEASSNWESLTKAQIVQKVYDDFGVELDEDDLKSELVAQAQEVEAEALA